jgi:hypothetical protein
MLRSLLPRIRYSVAENARLLRMIRSLLPRIRYSVQNTELMKVQTMSASDVPNGSVLVPYTNHTYAVYCTTQYIAYKQAIKCPVAGALVIYKASSKATKLPSTNQAIKRMCMALAFNTKICVVKWATQ